MKRLLTLILFCFCIFTIGYAQDLKKTAFREYQEVIDIESHCERIQFSSDGTFEVHPYPAEYENNILTPLQKGRYTLKKDESSAEVTMEYLTAYGEVEYEETGTFDIHRRTGKVKYLYINQGAYPRRTYENFKKYKSKKSWNEFLYGNQE